METGAVFAGLHLTPTPLLRSSHTAIKLFHLSFNGTTHSAPLPLKVFSLLIIQFCILNFDSISFTCLQVYFFFVHNWLISVPAIVCSFKSNHVFLLLIEMTAVIIIFEWTLTQGLYFFFFRVIMCFILC